MAILGRSSQKEKEEVPPSLLELIKNGTVCFLKAPDRNCAIERLVKALVKAGDLKKDQKAFQEALFRREEIVSTGIGMGVAIPHAKLSEFNRFFLAIGVQTLPEGIEWNSLDGTPVRLIFLIGGPSNQQKAYLNILSQLTASIKNDQRLNQLMRAGSKADILSVFESL